MYASRQVLARQSVRRILRHRTFRVKNPRHRRWDGFADLCFCSFVRQGEINVPLDFHRCLRGRSDDAHCDCESQEALTRTLGSAISVKFLWKLAKIFHDASPLLHRKKTKPFLLKQIGLLSCWGCRLVTLVHRKSGEFCWLDLHGVGARRFKTAFHRDAILADLFL